MLECGVDLPEARAVANLYQALYRLRKALGAEVVLVPQAPGSIPGQVTGTDLSLVEKRAQELTAQREAFRADQFVRLANRLAHQRHTGAELWGQTSGEIDAFCDRQRSFHPAD